MIRKHPSSKRRSGVVLLVVITLLALFAAMGLSFVFYAEGEALTSQYSSDAENKNKVDVDPELLLSYFLGKSLYGEHSHFSSNGTVPSGLYSSMRGLDLATSAYGYNYVGLNPNTTPFNGVEKVNFQVPTMFPGVPNQPTLTYADIVNFTYYPQDRFIIDPERMSLRNQVAPPGSPSYPQLMSQQLSTPYVGWNVPYTYADQNNFFLGAMNASGELLAPSFFRTYPSNPNPATFLPMDPTNPNWLSKEPYLKYLTARPHPSVHPNFPLPQPGGDVKNLDFGPGLRNPSGGYYPNDSIWMDMGFPVITGPDGRKFKPMFAPLIISLDGKINVNACGNIRNAAGGGTNASNLGLGPWEISLAPFLNAPPLVAGNPTDYPNLFLGVSGASGAAGRYGSSGQPGIANTSISAPISSLAPSYQGALDLDATLNDGSFQQTTKFLVQGETNGSYGTNPNPLYTSFPYFPKNGYATYGQSPNSGNELANHPAAYNPFNPPLVGNTSTNRTFLDSNMEAMLRYRGTGSPALSSDLFRLCYNSLNDPSGHNRMSLTTRSFSFGAPAVAPWLNGFDPSNTLLPNAVYPTGTPASFTAPVNPAGEFGSGSFYNPQFLFKKVNLNRPLTAYPPPSANGVITNLSSYQLAVSDRQALAQDIFNVLLRVAMGIVPPTGSTQPTLPNPGNSNYQATMWLAQLSVNMVDFIDSDNYITPFNWNPADTSPNGWVYGTEQPRLVINEAYAQIDNIPGDPMIATNGTASGYNVNTWVELYNPLQADPAILDLLSGSAGQGVVRLEMPGIAGGTGTYSIYKLALSSQSLAGSLFTDTKGTPAAQLFLPDGVTPVGVNSYSPTTASLALQTVTPVPAQIGAITTNYYRGPEGGNGGFYVIGPTLGATPNPFPATGPGRMKPTLPIPTLPTNMTYQVTIPATGSPNFQTNFFLRRLVCPDLPPQETWPIPAGKGYYNPYVTVDYFTLAPPQAPLTVPQVNDARTYAPNVVVPSLPQNRYSYGRMQPFVATMPMQQLPIPAHMNSPQHTFFRHNAQQATATNPLPPSGTQTLTIPFNWLVHLDRQLTSPLELLHVSAYPPYQLTQLFMMGTVPYGHMSMPAWFDSNARIYRALEFFDAGIRATAIDPYGHAIPLQGRIAGKININEIWDKKQLRALCDPQPGLSTFWQPLTPTNTNQYQQVDAVFAQIMASRSPNYNPSSNSGPAIGPADRPFKGMASGNMAAGYGIQDTFLRPVAFLPPNTVAATNSDPNSRLFGIPYQIVSIRTGNNPANVSPPPYVKMELMNKIFNNITCQSNVFAVWLTVGFFDVTDGPITTALSATPPLVTPPGGVNITVQGSSAIQYVATAPPALLPALTGTQLGVPWTIQKGCGIWVDNEPMTVKSVSNLSAANTYTITFYKPFVSNHGPSPVSMKGVLGAEVGLSEGRNVRHRMFSIVDRSALSIPSQLAQVTGASGAVVQKSAHALPALPPTQPLIVLPMGQSGSTYPPGANPPGYTVFVPGGPFVTHTYPVHPPGIGLTATTTNGSSWVTFTGTPLASPTVPPTPPTNYFRLHLKTAGTPVPQYFKITIPQQGTVLVNQSSGVTNLNFPSQSGPPAVPSMNVSYPWRIQSGMSLVISGIDANTGLAIQETLQNVQVNGTTITANFANAYMYNPTASPPLIPIITLPGQPGAVPGSILGNPGPQQFFNQGQNTQQRFDHRQNTALVPHYSIIQ